MRGTKLSKNLSEKIPYENIIKKARQIVEEMDKNSWINWSEKPRKKTRQKPYKIAPKKPIKMSMNKAQKIVDKYTLFLFYADDQKPIRSWFYLQSMIFVLRKTIPELDQALNLLDNNDQKK